MRKKVSKSRGMVSVTVDILVEGERVVVEVGEWRTIRHGSGGRIVFRGVVLPPSGGVLFGQAFELFSLGQGDIAMLEGAGFQIDEQMAAQDAVVEDEIEIVVLLADGDSLLARLEANAVAECEQEELEMVEQRGSRLLSR